MDKNGIKYKKAKIKETGRLPKKKEFLLNKAKNKLSTLFIYINFVILYFIIYQLYRSNTKLKDFIYNNKNFYIIKDNSSEKIDYDSIMVNHMRTSIDWPLPKEIRFRPMLTNKELKAFLSFMKPENIYFEFGSGGSTNVASYYKLKVFSVESDANWHKQLKNAGIIANFITVDLKVIPLGYPGNETTIEDWKKYIQAYKSEYNADIILIDGRFRVACSLDIFPKIRKDTMVLIHDYTNRPEYHIIEKFYIKIRTWDTLALFFKNTSIESIPQDLYNKYLSDKKVLLY